MQRRQFVHALGALAATSLALPGAARADNDKPLRVIVGFAAGVLASHSWELALVCLAPVPLIVWGSFKVSGLLEPRYAAVRAAVGDLSARVENNIAGILVIKSFTAEAYEARRVEEASDAYRLANRHAIRLSAAFIPVIRMAIAVGFAGVIALGMVPRAEGDYLVAATWEGYTLLGTALVVLAYAVATLRGPGESPTDEGRGYLQ